MPKKSDLDIKKSAQRIRKVTVSEKFFNKIPQDLRCFATTLSNTAKVQQSDMILRSLDGALASGESFESWSDNLDMDAIKRISQSNLKTVYRTAEQRAKNVGVFEKGIDDPNIEYFLYDATLDSATRPNHAALDGTIKKKTDPFWFTNTPPIGFNCRCVLQSLTKKQAQRVSGKTNPVTTDAQIAKSARDVEKEIEEATGRKVKIKKDDKRGYADNKFDGGIDYLKQSDRNLRKLIRNKIPKKFQKQFIDKLDLKDAKAKRYIEKVKPDLN